MVDLTCADGKTATANQSKDNLNELLNVLHIGSLTVHARTVSGPPDSPACTASLRAGHTSVPGRRPTWSLARQVYLKDETNPANTGTYPLHNPIRTADLQAFETKSTGGGS